MFISLDLETTGFDPAKDKIIEFGAVKFNYDGQISTYKTLINPGIRLPEIITHITGITDSDLKNAPKFKDQLEEIKAFIGTDPIIGHNISFDTTFLKLNGIELTNAEFDTCTLSSILLPSLPSYSLEILSRQLNLTHEEKHRALDDSIAAMELFLKLKEKFEELAPEIIQKIHLLCQKTKWPATEFLLSLKAKAANPQAITKKEFITKEVEIDPAIIKKESALIEISPPYENLIKTLAEKADKDSYIAIDNNCFDEIIKQLPPHIAAIDSPKNYLSLKRLEEFSQKEFYEDYEIISLLKYLIWKDQTQTGHLSEITLFAQEKTTIPRINIDENLVKAEEEFFYKKACEKDAEKTAIISHKYLIEQRPEIEDLILIDYEKFIKSLFFQNNIYLKLDILLNQLKAIREAADSPILEALETKSTILFGFIGILLQKIVVIDEWGSTAFVNESDFGTKEWLDIKNAVLSLIEASKELGTINNEKTAGHLQNWKKTLQYLYEIFTTQNLSTSIIWLEEDHFQNLIIKKAPTSIKENVAEILANTKSYKILSENLELNSNADFIKSLTGLPQELKTQNLTKQNPHLNIYVAENIPGDPHEKQLLNHLTEYLKIKKGRTAIVFTNKQKISQYTIALGQNLENSGIKIYSQLTGSLGKITDQFKQDPDNSVIIFTANNFENFTNPELIDTLVVHKVPFDPPSETFTLALGKNFEKSFETFQIPRAIFALKRLVNCLNCNDKRKKETLILDGRLEMKPYGKAFIENLHKLGTTEIINLATLAKLSS